MWKMQSRTLLFDYDILVKPTRDQTLGVGYFGSDGLGQTRDSIGSYDVFVKKYWNPS